MEKSRFVKLNQAIERDFETLREATVASIRKELHLHGKYYGFRGISDEQLYSLTKLLRKTFREEQAKLKSTKLRKIK